MVSADGGEESGVRSWKWEVCMREEFLAQRGKLWRTVHRCEGLSRLEAQTVVQHVRIDAISRLISRVRGMTFRTQAATAKALVIASERAMQPKCEFAYLQVQTVVNCQCVPRF